MSYDIKPRPLHQPPANARGGTLLGIFVGLVFGVAIAAAVVWYMRSSPSPFVEKVGATAKPASPAPAPTPATATPAPVAAAPAQPLPLPGKPGDTPPEQRFQFYDILSGKKEAVPDPKAPAPKDNKPAGNAAETDKAAQKIFLQTGSFSKLADADNQKARLALLGVEASVQQANLDDKTLYRVRLGPFSKMEDVSRVRSELAISGIEASLVKNKE